MEIRRQKSHDTLQSIVAVEVSMLHIYASIIMMVVKVDEVLDIRFHRITIGHVNY